MTVKLILLKLIISQGGGPRWSICVRSVVKNSLKEPKRSNSVYKMQRVDARYLRSNTCERIGCESPDSRMPKVHIYHFEHFEHNLQEERRTCSKPKLKEAESEHGRRRKV